MFKENKWKIFWSSVIILLPILAGLILWDRLPNSMSIHWGADGNADGVAGKAFSVFFLPLLFLGLNFLCLWLTSLDKAQKRQHPKALNVIFWIMPCVSLFASGMIYSAALGATMSAVALVPVLLGLMFMFLGNYMPKTKQNHTLGIKISWTIRNEENWNKTHRFGGKVWFIGGLVLVFTAFLPWKILFPVMLVIILALVLLPFGYSYRIYRQHRKAGIAYTAAPLSRGEKAAKKIALTVVPLLLVGVAVLMFTGDIWVQYHGDSFTVDATYWGDLNISYSDIERIEYREDVDTGMRANGYQSAKLALGTYENEEFGMYTRYTFAGNGACVVLESDGKVLVINGADAAATRGIYEELLLRTGK